jgi:hypothetical protein
MQDARNRYNASQAHSQNPAGYMQYEVTYEEWEIHEA